MPKLVPFTKHEAVLLLDAYLRMVNNNQQRSIAVKQVSADLRKMAINNGIEIDDIYRNSNGITFQMASMESAYVGRTIMKPSTKLFTETVALYRQNRSKYDKILEEAMAMVNGKKKNEELFADWLAKTVPANKLSDLYLCYSAIESYCLRIKVLQKPLFETTDLATVKKVQKTVTESRLFKLAHKKKMNLMVAAAQYYTAFVKELSTESASAFPMDAYSNNDSISDSLVSESNEVIKEKTDSQIEEAGYGKDIVIDFHQTHQNLAYTSPKSFVYFDKVYNDVSNWTQLYVQFFICLLKDYPDIISNMVNSNISGSHRKDIGSAESYQTMTAPKKVSDKLYLETNLSATDIVTKIHILLDKCKVNYDNIEIKYSRRDQKQIQGKEAFKEISSPIADDNRDTVITVKSDPVTEFLEKKQLEYFDLRNKGGCLWIVGTLDKKNDLLPLIKSGVDLHFKENGGNATSGRPAWWTTKNTSQIRLLEDVTAQSPKTTSNFVNQEELFRNWMIQDQDMAEISAQIYSSAICSCEQLAQKYQLAETKLYGADYSTVQRVRKGLILNTAKDEDISLSKFNRYRAALEKYLLYLRSLDQSSAVEVLNIAEYQQVDTTPFENVLEQYFVKGFRLGSTLDMKKFKRLYEETNGASLNMDDVEIERTIISCGIVCESKVFLPKTMLSEDIKVKLIAYIENAFNAGKKSIYFEALFREFSDDFLDYYIYNAEMLRSYLAFVCRDKYVIGRNQISRDGNVSTEPIDEIRSCLKEHCGPMETDDICSILNHLPPQKIYTILGTNLEFVRNSKGEYFHADVMALSEEELENIAELIAEAIQLHGYMSGTELINAIRTKYPNTYEGYSNYSDIGWRDALKYKLGDRFSFRGNIVSSIGVTLSMSDVFGQLAAGADTLTMDELCAFADDMGTSVYLDAVYQNALRIDEGTFVSKKRAAFQVEETDRILDRFCTGNYIPLTEVHDFGIFPDAGFPWTVYLLESYATFYSERYTLVHGGYNRYCAVGAIAKKSASYKSFDDLVVDVIADSGIPLTKDDAIEYLVESGYIARRSYANIEELLIRANAQRNRKGRL